jgi:hypothetical protein
MAPDQWLGQPHRSIGVEDPVARGAQGPSTPGRVGAQEKRDGVGAAAPAKTGPLFRRLYKGGKVGIAGLSADQVARIVQRRAKLAGLEGDWAAHSLRSGFVTEAGRQGVPLGEVMAMTEHRSVTTVMGYFQAGSLLSSRATSLLVDSEALTQGGPPKAETTETDLGEE